MTYFPISVKLAKIVPTKVGLSVLLFSDYKYHPSPIYKDIGPYTQGTELVFYIQPGPPCGGEYLSTSQNARVTQPDSDTYRIEWEDKPPAQGDDWNDLIVDVECGITTCDSDQWRGEYFSNQDLEGTPTYIGCDSDIDFYWGQATPTPGIPKDNFSVRWTRDMVFPTSGIYRFRTFTDDGCRLEVAGRRISDDDWWRTHSFLEESARTEVGQGTRTIKMEYFEQWTDALAHLSWYLCPEGEDDCNMDIQPMYQNQDPWEDDPMGDAGGYIYEYGCLITSIAMALRAHEIDTSPEELNDWLNDPEVGGYIPGSANLGGWDKIEDFARKKFEEQKKYGVRLKAHPHLPKDDSAVMAKIREGIPVILKTQVGGNSHFVLATDVVRVPDEHGVLSSPTFGINDPLLRFRRPYTPRVGPYLNHCTTLLDCGYGGTYSQYYYLERTSDPKSPSLSISAVGTQCLLTDSQGRQTGYDPATAQIITDIPSSSYYEYSINPPGLPPSNPTARILELQENAGGMYQLQVIGAGEGEFTVMFSGYNSQYVASSAVITGEIQSGAVVNFDVEFDPGQDIDVTPHCPGDANGDEVVNAVDLSILSSEWGRNCSLQPCQTDFNQDGIVNAVDLSILAANWGRLCS